MAVALAGVSTGVFNNNASQLVVPVPVGAADGELLFEAEIFRQSPPDATTPPLTPSGWARNNPIITNNGQFTSYRRPAAAPEPASYTFQSGQLPNRCAAIMCRLAGVDLSAPIDAEPATANTGLTASGITTNTPGALLVMVLVAHMGSLSTAGSDVPGMSLAKEVQAGSSSTSYLAVWIEPRPAAGATGSRTAAITGGVVPTSASCFLIAIKPSPTFGIPTGLAVAPSGGGLALSWNATPNAAAYDVQRDGVTIIASDLTTPAYTDDGVDPGSTHGYRVRAKR